MKLTLFANADLLVEDRGLRLFFDAFHESVLGYPATPEAAFRIPADYLLYTHIHADHFSPFLVRDYLALHPACKVIGTLEVLSMLSSLGVSWKRLKRLEREESLSLPGMRIRAIPGRHIGSKCRFTQNTAFLLEGSGRLLVPGDASPTAANFAGRGIGELDCIAAPEYFVRVESAQRMYSKDISTRSILLLHTPGTEPLPDRPYQIFRPALLEAVEVCYNKD